MCALSGKSYHAQVFFDAVSRVRIFHVYKQDLAKTSLLIILSPIFYYYDFLGNQSL